MHFMIMVGIVMSLLVVMSKNTTSDQDDNGNGYVNSIEFKKSINCGSLIKSIDSNFVVGIASLGCLLVDDEYMLWDDHGVENLSLEHIGGKCLITLILCPPFIDGYSVVIPITLWSFHELIEVCWNISVVCLGNIPIIISHACLVEKAEVILGNGLWEVHGVCEVLACFGNLWKNIASFADFEIIRALIIFDEVIKL